MMPCTGLVCIPSALTGRKRLTEEEEINDLQMLIGFSFFGNNPKRGARDKPVTQSEFSFIVQLKLLLGAVRMYVCII